jgi:hypothetical protein
VLFGTSVNIMSIFRSCAGKWHYLYACYFIHGHLVSQLKIYCLFCVQIYETSAAAVHKSGVPVPLDNLLRIFRLAPKILKWLLDFLKICGLWSNMSGLAITNHVWYLFENVMVLLCKFVEMCQIGWSFWFPGSYIMEVCCCWSGGNIVTWKLLRCALWINTILHFYQAKHSNLRHSDGHSESLCFWIWCVVHVKAQMALIWL